MRPTPARLEISPCSHDAIGALQEALGCSAALAQILVRRGLADPAAASAWLAAAERHPPTAFAGIVEACRTIVGHVRGRTRITVHGDYDVDGVSSTAILVRTLRTLGADVDWFLPSRSEDGYGLAAATVARLAARGTRLLLTVDCGITAVEEVAAARAAGLDVVVCDHHQPRADGALPDAPIVHPLIGGYPCADLCAAGVAYKLSAALLAACGHDPREADRDLDLVALATVADCVPLHGENRRLVREGLRALATTARPGLRALMAVARADPARIDEKAIGFRLAPRINAAGRMQRADAGLELLLTSDAARAEQIAAELDQLNGDRRHVETQILFAAEAQVAEQGERSAYVLAGEDWHPGVIGIVASRVAERHHRPVVMIALDPKTGEGTGSGRSIAGFDLLAGFDASAEHLLRHGGHRAAAGCTIRAESVDAFRAAFDAHAAATLTPDDLAPTQRVDAVVGGDELGLGLAEELEALAPFGIGNPSVALLLPAARFSDPRPMGEGRHVRFVVQNGGALAKGVAFGTPSVECEQPVDAVFALELDEYRGSVTPRLVLKTAGPCVPAPIEVVGAPGNYLDAALAELDADLPTVPTRPAAVGPRIVDRRGRGVAATIAAFVATGDPVLVVGACNEVRARQLGRILGGFRLCSHAALERDPGLAQESDVVVLLDPPAGPVAQTGRTTVLAWGDAELVFAEQIHEREYALRAVLAATYRALRAAGGAGGEELEALLRGDTGSPCPASVAGRVLRVLAELHLVSLDRATRTVTVPPAEPTALERSEAFRAYHQRYEDGRLFLTGVTAKAA